MTQLTLFADNPPPPPSKPVSTAHSAPQGHSVAGYTLQTAAPVLRAHGYAVDLRKHGEAGRVAVMPPQAVNWQWWDVATVCGMAGHLEGRSQPLDGVIRSAMERWSKERSGQR